MTAQTESTPPRPDDYAHLSLAIVFADSRIRDDLRCLKRVCSELMTLGDNVLDPGVAAVKLQWWREEIMQALDHRGQHPLSTTIAHLADRYGLGTEDFLALTDAAPMYAPANGYPNYAALYAYLHRSGAVPARMAATVAGFADRGSARFAELLGICARLVEIVRNLGADARQGRIYLPRDRMDALGIEHTMLSGEKTPPAVIELLAEMAQVTRDRYDEALASLAVRDRPRQRPLLIAGALYIALLDFMQKQQFPVIEQRPTLHPAYRLWVAWRTARREARLCKGEKVD